MERLDIFKEIPASRGSEGLNPDALLGFRRKCTKGGYTAFPFLDISNSLRYKI